MNHMNTWPAAVTAADNLLLSAVKPAWSTDTQMETHIKLQIHLFHIRSLKVNMAS